MTGYGPDVSGINGSLDFRVAHGNSWAGGGGQKRAQPVTWHEIQWANNGKHIATPKKNQTYRKSNPTKMMVLFTVLGVTVH